MKNILILFLVVFGLTSCSKDSLDQNIDQLLLPGKSEIMVKVTYLTFADQFENSCGNKSVEVVSFMANAKVELYQGEQNESDALGIPMMNVTTDVEGSALMQDIEPAVYTVWVDTPLGKKSRTLTTQLHKRSYIDFSF